MNLEDQSPQGQGPHLRKGLLASLGSNRAAAPHPRLRLYPAFASHYLPDKRDLIVGVPPGYDEHPQSTYPVLYLQEAQNLFDPRTAFILGRTWEVREHADAAIRAGEVERLIIVGIYNTGDRRLAEYTPARDPGRDWPMGSGEAAQYA